MKSFTAARPARGHPEGMKRVTGERALARIETTAVRLGALLFGLGAWLAALSLPG